MKQIKRLLDDEIKTELEKLSKLEPGSSEHKATVDSVARLVEKRNELEKSKDSKIDRYVTNGIAIAGIIVPSLITIWGTLATFKFEEDGTVSTVIGRGFINKLLPRK